VQVLLQRGYVVSGSIPGPGRELDRLKRLGIRVHSGHSTPPLPHAARLLVYGPSVPREHPARLSATVRGVEQASGAELLDDLIGQKTGIATSGGRAAGVAAAMVGWTLAYSGLDPTVLLATPAAQLGGWGRLGQGPHVVIETGEPDAIGWPEAEISLILGGRHPEDGERALARRAWEAPRGGYVLGLASSEGPTSDDWPAGVEVERFSLERGHAWWGADLRHERGLYRFRAFHRGRFALEVGLQIPGRQHVLAALAAVAIGGRVDLTSRAIKEALEEFAGVSRGFESRGSYRGVTLVDDEASGALAVAEVMALAREVFGRRRLCAAYRPDVRGGGPWPGSAEFAAADLVLVVDEDGPSGGSMALALVEALLAAGARAWRASGIDEAIRELDRTLEPGDVLVTLGDGDVGTIADAFLRRLSSNRHAG
jgi:UDP-N-acetylmuramate--alanine ligase